MILCIANVLSPSEIAQLTDPLPATWVDGKETAGWHARLVKHNTQLPEDHPLLGSWRSVVEQALLRNDLFQMASRPQAMRPILFSRYERGMSYGRHIDNALMGSPPLRADLSFTLFLSHPTTYTGGELVIESAQGEEGFKLEAGSLILYPSSTLHRVEPVTAGIRLAAVSWLQSLIRDPSQREILFDLDTARQTLFEQQGKSAVFDLISKSHANLLRQWAEL